MISSSSTDGVQFECPFNCERDYPPVKRETREKICLGGEADDLLRVFHCLSDGVGVNAPVNNASSASGTPCQR